MTCAGVTGTQELIGRLNLLIFIEVILKNLGFSLISIDLINN